MSDNEKLIDFDAFRSEQKQEPLQIKIGGDTFDLPSDLPAGVMLDYLRLLEEKGDDAYIEPEELAGIMRHMFGTVTLEALTDKHRLSSAELIELFKQTMHAYTSKVARPNRAARRV